MAKSTGEITAQSKQNPQGIQVKAPPTNQYLCQHICRCSSKTVLVDTLGRHLRQRCVTAGVRNDYDHDVQNVYLGEVGYDVTKTPPAPLMSAQDPRRPSRFPLGAAILAGLLNRTKAELEAVGGSAFRIPDVIKIKDPSKPPEQSNIDGVIEIKLKGDQWRPGQKKSYEKIAGDPDNLILLKEEGCTCDGPRKQPKDVPVSKPVVDPLASPGIRKKYYPQPGMHESITPLSDYLIDTAKVVGGVILISGSLYVLVETLGSAAPLSAAAFAEGSAMITGVWISAH